MGTSLVANPGSPGAFGALMDECARAAEDLLRVAESFAAAAWAEERPAADPDCRSPRAICEHVVYAALGYDNYLRRLLDLPAPDPRSPEREAQRLRLSTPAELRPALADAIRRTEASGDALRAGDEDPLWTREIRTHWGATFQPESLLEHAIVHLLRHRRQLERWRASA